MPKIQKMAVRIDQVWSQLRVVEGGYKADPSDLADYNSKGELVGTNMGVSAPTYEEVLGRPPSMADMKAIPVGLAQQVADERFLKPNKLHILNSAPVASILLGAIYHRPALGSYFLGEALNRLGESLPTTTGDDFKPIKRPTLKSEWVAQMNFHIKRVGEAGAHNAIWNVLKDYYQKQGWENQINNRLYKSGAYELLPEVCQSDFKPSLLFGADENVTCYEKQSMPFAARQNAKVQGWWEDLTSVRYARTNPQVWPDFWRALAVLLMLLGAGYMVYHFSTKKSSSHAD